MLITVDRDRFGVPHIEAKSAADLYHALGSIHISDRYVQMMISRAVARGRLSEILAGTGPMIRTDIRMRRIDFAADAAVEISRVSPEALEGLEAYCDGVNAGIRNRRRPFKFILSGYRPEPWTPDDVILVTRSTSYIGLAQSQELLEKFILGILRRGMNPEKVRALFPALTDAIDVPLLEEIRYDPLIPPEVYPSVPAFTGSNNWVVHGSRTASGKPLLAADPHMEINRLPPLWYEASGRIDGASIMGATIPGIPLFIFGRTDRLAWAQTTGFMDMIDFFIEECTPEKYLYGGEWHPLKTREITLRPKGCKPISFTCCGIRDRVLELMPEEPGKYLSFAYTGRRGVGAEIFNVMHRVQEISGVREAQGEFRRIPIPSANYLFADSSGNIGYQAIGKVPLRARGFSGLLPIPGWDPKTAWRGYIPSEKLPRCINPPEGYFATANNDLNRYGKSNPVSVAMADYRVDRIVELLKDSRSIDFEYVKGMQYDSISRQARRFMPEITAHVPNTERGRALEEWDFSYFPYGAAAEAFEAVYYELLKGFFEENGIGGEAFEYLSGGSPILTLYFGSFDDVLLDERHPWFAGAVQRALENPRAPTLHPSSFRMVKFQSRGVLPGILGLPGPKIPAFGGRATIPQLQYSRIMGHDVIAGPSYRMIVDFGEPGMRTNLPGGPSGDRFSKWYTSDLARWKIGEYKRIL
ncbi:MAG: penicillin acylase family protein [Spirochaetota bacterium]